MSKVEYEYELNAQLGPHHATATQVKYRIRPVSAMVARRMEVARRGLHYCIEDNKLLWRFNDTKELLDAEGIETLNKMMDLRYKDRPVESTRNTPAMGVPVSTWRKEG